MISHDAGSYSHRPGQAGHDHPVVRLLLVVSGHLELTAGERRVSVESGFGAFVDGDTPYSYVSRGRVSYILADFCADPTAFQDVLAEPCTPLSTPALIAATSALIHKAFRSADASRDDEASAASQRARVLAHIAVHHSETDLNVVTLAAALGLSARSLQRLFADQDKGVAEEIAAARLDHALTLLRDPLLADLTLEEIAARSGFGSAARMRRTIRIATGKNPRECRAPYCKGDEREHPRHGPATARHRASGVEYPIAV